VDAERLMLGPVTVDVPGRRVWVSDRPVHLTATEFDLLTHLLRTPGRVWQREELLAAVWGYADAGSRTVDVHVAQLRAKLGADAPLRTVRGVGYAADEAAIGAEQGRGDGAEQGGRGGTDPDGHGGSDQRGRGRL